METVEQPEGEFGTCARACAAVPRPFTNLLPRAAASAAPEQHEQPPPQQQQEQQQQERPEQQVQQQPEAQASGSLEAAAAEALAGWEPAPKRSKKAKLDGGGGGPSGGAAHHHNNNGHAAAPARAGSDVVTLGERVPRGSERLAQRWRPVTLSAEDRAPQVALDAAQLSASSSRGYRMVRGEAFPRGGTRDRVPGCLGLTATAAATATTPRAWVPSNLHSSTHPSPLSFPAPAQARATHGVHSGTWYYEARVDALGPTGAVRLGWATRRAEVQAPVGTDDQGYAYRSSEGSKVRGVEGGRGAGWAGGRGDARLLGWQRVQTDA